MPSCGGWAGEESRQSWMNWYGILARNNRVVWGSFKRLAWNQETPPT